ncbi:MAG TPA: nucleotidyltransferase family protein [Candidatus Sulfotelmatobacter sp.]|jgi:predicted nucleotidyltransferase|nr:nucleotidyltransferase family protein [Candidatus Sulfotelmatobacter sp.]
MRERRHSRRGLTEVVVWVPAEKAEAVRNYAHRIGQRRAAPEREEIIETLLAHQEILEKRFGVLSLSLFGSTRHNSAQPHSDIDLLVEFAPCRPSGLFEFVDLKHHLEGLLGRPVDLTTAATLKPRLKGRILSDALLIY